MSTYRKIRELSNTLAMGSQKSRKEAGARLRELLGRPEIRKKLLEESNGHRGLAEMWRFVIINAILLVQSQTKSKVDARDIELPLNLLRICDKKDDPSLIYEPSKLSKKEARMVFTFYYDLTQDEELFKIAEGTILDGMAYLCSQRTYVAYMRPNQEIDAILQEVERRVLAEENITHTVLGSAAIWENLMHTAATDLGIGLHIFMPGCVKMVALWCERNRNIPHSAAGSIYRGLNYLLESDLEQAVAPLARHGRSILGFAKRNFAASACDQTKDAFLIYFRVHLRIALVAGALQGLLPADLGDLGNSSLGSRQLYEVLNILFLATKKIEDSSWPPTPRTQLCLEVVAKFLACSQRIHISEATWNEWGDPADVLISCIEEATASKRNERVPLLPSALLKTPFVERVLVHLLPVVRVTSYGGDSELLNNLLEQTLVQPPIDITAVRVALQTITACASYIPSGSCWILSGGSKWRRLPTNQEGVNWLQVCSPSDLSTLIHSVASVLEWCGRPAGDSNCQNWALASLSVLSTSAKTVSLLCTDGDPNSFECVEAAWRRVWVMLFRADLRYRQFTKETSGTKSELVTKLLFDVVRNFSLDFQLDSNADPSVRRSTFLYRHQRDVWALPMFACSAIAQTRSSMPFSLICAIASTVGVEPGRFFFREDNTDRDFFSENGVRLDLRSSLIRLCLKSLSRLTSPRRNNVQIACSAALGVLVTGKSERIKSVSSLTTEFPFACPRNVPDDMLQLIWSPAPFDLKNFVSPVEDSSRSLDSFDYFRSELLERLSHEDGFSFQDTISATKVKSLKQFVLSELTELCNVPESGGLVALDNLNADISGNPEEAFQLMSTSLDALRASVYVCLEDCTALSEPFAELLSTSVARLLEKIVSKLVELSRSKALFVSVFSPLTGLLKGLTRILCTEVIGEFPRTLMDSLSSLFRACYTLLEDSCSIESSWVSSSRENSSQTSDDLLFDGDDEEVRQPRLTEKRKRRDPGGPERPKKRVASSGQVPDTECLYFLSKVLLILRPSYDVCRLVAKSFSGADMTSSSFPETVDVLGGAVASRLLCTGPTILFSSAIQDGIVSEHAWNRKEATDSVVLLIGNVISAVRTYAPPESEFHLFGLDLCSFVVRALDGGEMKCELTEEEAKQVSELLLTHQHNDERKTLHSRPRYRAYQLHNAVEAFAVGKERFHENFDKVFPRNLVMPSLTDINSSVRRIATRAVSASLQLLPPQKVIAGVGKRVPSFAVPEEKERQDYRKWYLPLSLGCGDGFETVEKQAWEDAMASVRHEVLRLRSAIACASPDTTFSYVLDLIEMASLRPHLETLVFVLLDELAVSTGLADVDSLLGYFAEKLLCTWIESDRSLFDLPLVFSCPGVFRKLLQDGVSSLFLSKLPEHLQCRVAERAATEFLSAQTSLLLALVLNRCVSVLSERSPTKDYRRRFLEEKYLKELCSMFEDRYDDDVVRKVLKSHVLDIFCYQAARLSAESEVYVEVERLVKTLLGNGSAVVFSPNGFHKSKRKLLQLALPEDSASNNGFWISLKNISAHFYHADDAPTDVATCTCDDVDTLFYARNLSLRRAELGQREWSWVPLDILVSNYRLQVEKKNVNKVRLKIVLELVSGLLVNKKAKLLHVDAIRALRMLLGEILVNTEVGKTLSRVVVDVLYVAFNCLADCLKRYISKYTDWKEKMKLTVGEARGMIRDDDISATEESNLAFNEAVELRAWGAAHSTSTLDEYFQLITVVVDSGSEEILTGKDISEAYQVSELVSVQNGEYGNLHPGFDFQDWLDRRLGVPCPDKQSELELFPPHARSRGIFPLPPCEVFSGLQTGRFLMELRKLEIFLRSSRTGSLSPLPVHDTLLKHLRRLVTPSYPMSYPMSLRIAASRCLGEVDLDTSQTDETNENESKIADKEVYSFAKLLVPCIEILCSSLQSADPSLGLLANDTLKAVLATRLGKNCASLMTEGPSVAMLQQIADGLLVVSKSNVCLTPQMRKSSQTDKGEYWCWDESLWAIASDGDWRFDNWICDVVSAIIVCCYHQPSETSGEEEAVVFFRLCGRMSYSQPRFAARLFPALIVDLLTRCGRLNMDDKVADPVLVAATIGDPTAPLHKSLSLCFRTLLCTGMSSTLCSRTDKEAAVLLAAETLDKLRQLSLQRFTSSGNHKKNKNDGSTKNVSSHWAGPKFGFSLDVNGLLLARAFMFAGCPESALFYSEYFADARFGGSFKAVDSIAALKRSKPIWLTIAPDRGELEIPPHRSKETSGGSDEMAEHLLFLRLLQNCYDYLEDSNMKEVVEGCIADASFLDVSSQVPLPLSHMSHSLLLGQLDTACRTRVLRSPEKVRNSNITAIADALGGIGLDFTLEAYIEGAIQLCEDSLDRESIDVLIDEALKNRLYNMTWNDIPRETITEEKVTSVPWKIAGPSHGLVRSGRSFFSELVNGMVAMGSDEYPAALSHISEAREVLLCDPSNRILRNGFEHRTFRLIDKCRALNYVERLVEKQQDCRGELDPTVIKLCGLFSDEGSFSHDLTLCVKEASLRYFVRKASPLSLREMRGQLTSHLWTSLKFHMDSRNANQSRGVLSKIRDYLQSESLIEGTRCGAYLLLKARFEEAKLLNLEGGFSTAIRATKQVIGHLKDQNEPLDTDEKVLLADALVTCGSWMSKHKIEPAHVILESFLKPGATLSSEVIGAHRNNASVQESLAMALLAVSDLACSIFYSVSDRFQSTEWIQGERRLKEQAEKRDKLKEHLQRKRAQAKQGKKKDEAQLQALRQVERKLHKLGQEISQTKDHRHKIIQSHAYHQEVVLESTSKALQQSGVGSRTHLAKYMYRLIDLWLSDVHVPHTHNRIESIVEEAIEKIPSFRFVPLASQLFSHLGEETSSGKDTSQANLRKLVFKLCIGHPYHCLAHLFLLTSAASKKEENKNEAAEALIQNIRGERSVPWIGKLLDSYYIISNAYDKLARTKIDDDTKVRQPQYRFSNLGLKPADCLDTCLGRRVVEVEFPPCILTKPPPIRPDCDYGNGERDPIGAERIKGFHGTFTVPNSGVSRPKIVVCVGTRGGKYRQVVKGNDDARQDAIMQQVFGFLNELSSSTSSDVSHRDPRTRLVTYNIVPLSPDSGVIEWVEQSIPLIECVKDGGGSSRVGLHSRYYPGEWSPLQCMELHKKTPRGKKREAFQTICENFSPCLRFFFVENFSNSLVDWYEAKLRFTRSTAVSSLVGHILGIGDRHCSNILLHKGTGEVVHIDFGIIFERGKLLQVPELVPFRLTRNMVDPMGPLGVEGTFTKTAESTLRTLKENSNGLITILSAIGNDPTNAWALNPALAQRRHHDAQDDEDSQNFDDNVVDFNNSEATALAIRKVQEKLNGYEDGTSGEQQSVEGQVQFLISAARDPGNLSELYHGWNPWI